jgi:NAD(P)-dependent dehydrogenase (short-subunit alcohol dehydrogenase family)
MREQRSGHVVTISSLAGLAGFEYNSAYAASKFAVDGWMEALASEVAPFGIHVTVVNPGFFRTELLTRESTSALPRRRWVPRHVEPPSLRPGHALTLRFQPPVVVGIRAARVVREAGKHVLAVAPDHGQPERL